ncbi:ATP-binding protein [Streptomyces sp. M10(2022)]
MTQDPARRRRVMPMPSSAPAAGRCLGVRLSRSSCSPAPPHRAPPRRRWKATSVTLSTPSAPASDLALAGTVPRREYWFGLPALRTSARSARDIVRDRLRAWKVPGDTCCDAVLLVSELTTNAVLHTGSGHVLCGLTLSGDERCLRIELHDEDSTQVRPPEHHAGPCEESGRGLLSFSNSRTTGLRTLDAGRRKGRLGGVDGPP